MKTAQCLNCGKLSTWYYFIDLFVCPCCLSEEYEIIESPINNFEDRNDLIDTLNHAVQGDTSFLLSRSYRGQKGQVSGPAPSSPVHRILWNKKIDVWDEF